MKALIDSINLIWFIAYIKSTVQIGYINNQFVNDNFKI